MNKFKNIINQTKVPVIAILIGLIIGGIILFISGFDPIEGFVKMFEQTFTPNRVGQYTNLADVINSAIPLILCGFSVGFAYKAGLFNIGAEGQFMVGMICALFVGTLPLPDNLSMLHPILSILAGGIGGALWGLIPGLLRAFFKVSEVVVTILMNLIALKAITIIVQTWFHSPDKTTMTPQILESSKIQIFGTPFTIGIFIVIIVAIFYYFIFKHTTLGYELKAVGFNLNASKYAGINEKNKIILAMVISGFFAGLAGSIYGLQLGVYTANGNNLNYGFNGIVVSMLGNVNALGTVISGLLIAFFSVGTKFIDIGIQSQLGEIIVAIIFIASSIGAVINQKKSKGSDK